MLLGVAEDIIIEMSKEQSKGVSAVNNAMLQQAKVRMVQALGYKKMVISRGKQKNKNNRDRKDKGDDADVIFTPRTPLMERVCDQIKHMKEDFLILNFYSTCKYCHAYLNEGVYYKCS